MGILVGFYFKPKNVFFNIYLETGASAPYAHLARNTSAADKLLLKQNDVQINISGGFTIKIFAGTWIRTREGGVVALVGMLGSKTR